MGAFSGYRKGLVVPIFYLLSTLLASCGVKKQSTVSRDTTIHTISMRNANVYLVERDQRLLMIDAGYAKDSMRLYEAIADLGYSPDSIEYLILTHAHGDHVGTASFFQRKTGCVVIAGAPDAAHLSSGRQVDICPVGGLAKILTVGMNEFFPPVEPDSLVFLNQSISLPDWEMEIQLAPGHTPGSLFCLASYGIFVGDLVRGRPLAKKKAARHYFMCDLEDNDRDIRDLYDRTPDQVLWYPGHFGPLQRVMPEDL